MPSNIGMGRMNKLSSLQRLGRNAAWAGVIVYLLGAGIALLLQSDPELLNLVSEILAPILSKFMHLPESDII